MSLRVRPFPALPEETMRVARRALRKGSLYLVLGEQIGHIFEDDDFRDLYALQGEPALSPAQLTLVLFLQALEGLSDREAAEAVRARIDWKYALHLSLEDQGFDFSALADFRARLVSHEAGTRVLDHLLQRLRVLQLLKERGQQRTDASYVLSAARSLNRLELVWESMWVTLEELAKAAPVWLRGVALPHWGERYDMAWRGSRLPKGKEQRSALAASIGADGAHLLAAGRAPGAPKEVGECAAFQLLEKIWAQQYEQGAEGWRWRAAGTLPAGAELIQTPYDAEARYGEHHEHSWKGYTVHFTETCDPDSPRLITRRGHSGDPDRCGDSGRYSPRAAEKPMLATNAFGRYGLCGRAHHPGKRARLWHRVDRSSAREHLLASTARRFHSRAVPDRLAAEARRLPGGADFLLLVGKPRQLCSADRSYRFSSRGLS
jgi:transposase